MKTRILIVDDDANVRRELGELASTFGFAPSVAQSIDEAIEILATGSTDILLLDLNFKGRKGPELLKYLSEHTEPPNRIFLMTGLAPTYNRIVAEEAEALTLPIQGLLQKPINPSYLKALLELTEAYPAISEERYKERRQADTNELSLSDVQSAYTEGRIWFLLQPQRFATDFRIAGFEALVRITGSDGTEIGPNACLHHLEHPEFAERLLRHALGFACSVFKRTVHVNADFSVSINIPNELLDSQSAIDSLLAIDQTYACRISLEITERSNKLKRLHRGMTMNSLLLHGYGISIDDFGTNSANLEDLEVSQICEIKFDKKLIQAATNNLKYQTFLEGIVELLREREVFTVAEGIENEQMLEVARTLKFDVLQGYYLGVPAPVDEALRNLEFEVSEPVLPAW